MSGTKGNELAPRVAPFSEKECPSVTFPGPPLFTWREFYTLRNAVLEVLQSHGTVGPSGKMPILDDWETSEDAWLPGVADPDFFVVSDMWNDRQRDSRVEAEPEHITERLLLELATMLREWPGWCVFLALGQGGLAVFADRILYEGELFTGCATVQELGLRCASAPPHPAA